MKTKFFMTLAIVLISACSSLQAGQPDKEKRDRVFPNEKMIKELKLSDKQVADLKKGDADLQVQMKALRDQKELSKKEMKESVEKMKDARTEMIKKNLTKEQYVTYLELQNDRLQKMNSKKGKQYGPRPQRPEAQGEKPTE